jgi:hypothetical protein
VWGIAAEKQQICFGRYLFRLTATGASLSLAFIRTMANRIMDVEAKFNVDNSETSSPGPKHDDSCVSYEAELGLY